MEQRHDRTRLHQERVASHGTRLYGCVRGSSARQIYVIEFPKSGGSWLAEMLASYFELPRPTRPTLPVLEPAVIHAHWNYTPRLRPVAYLVRDVRDVIVSAYFRWLWEIRNPPYQQTRSYVKRRTPVLFRADADDVRTNLPQFVREFAIAPVGTRLSWDQHVKQWIDRSHVTLARYEELLDDPATALEKLVASLSSAPVDPARLQDAIVANEFERKAGRSRGTEDRTSFLRRGVAGDWRNHCSPEAGELIDERFGSMLISLGYETRRDWWKHLEHPAE